MSLRKLMSTVTDKDNFLTIQGYLDFTARFLEFLEDGVQATIVSQDVQRKGVKTENRYGVSATFLPVHFKGYTVKLSPLDGVFYCDIRPNMRTDPLLSQHITTIDRLFSSALWQLVDE